MNGTATIAYLVYVDQLAAKVFLIRGFISICISLSIGFWRLGRAALHGANYSLHCRRFHTIWRFSTFNQKSRIDTRLRHLKQAYLSAWQPSQIAGPHDVHYLAFGRNAIARPTDWKNLKPIPKRFSRLCFSYKSFVNFLILQ